MQKLMKKHVVIRAVGDQCMYGLKSKDDKGEGFARKRTGFLTNSVCVAKRLSKMCPNRNGFQVHRHVRVECGRTRVAQVYPQELCRQMCKGIQEQVEADRQGCYLLAQVGSVDGTNRQEMRREANQITTKYRTVEENNDEELQRAWDDVTG